MVSPDVKSGSRLYVGRRQVSNMSYVYILKTSKDTYYIGSTDDIEKRIDYHQRGKVKSTKDKLPVSLVFKEYHKTTSEARIKESKIKKWKSRKMIEALIK